MTPTQNPKYSIEDGRLVDTKTGEPIPADVPIWIFTADDPNALKALYAVWINYPDGPKKRALEQRLREFSDFQHLRPDRMKPQ